MTVLAVALPGPWTPVIVLAYVLARANEDLRDATGPDAADPAPFGPPDPYACVPVDDPPHGTTPARSPGSRS